MDDVQQHISEALNDEALTDYKYKHWNPQVTETSMWKSIMNLVLNGEFMEDIHMQNKMANRKAICQLSLADFQQATAEAQSTDASHQTFCH